MVIRGVREELRTAQNGTCRTSVKNGRGTRSVAAGETEREVIAIKRLLCQIFGQCASEEVVELKDRLSKLEKDVYQEKRVAWDDLMVPKRNAEHGR
jgi:hypothetical protein